MKIPLALLAAAALSAAGHSPADYGILDVTKAPYSADPTGKRDSTEAIQKAVDYARDARMVVFLPSGDYRVSGAIRAGQKDQDRRENQLLGRRDDFPCVMWGAGRGRRTRIVLSDRAPGFGDPAHPKPVLHFLSIRKDGTADNPNRSFNQTILSLDVDLGRGNPGAIGIDNQGAQGSIVEDVNVRAEGAFAGFRGASGSGGSMSHISVRGGRYGLYLAVLEALEISSGSQPAPVISFVTLTGQTEKSVVAGVRGPLTLAGALIEGPGIRIEGPRMDYDGALNVIDSVIRYRGQGPVITGNRAVYLESVYVENAPEIARLGSAAALAGDGKGWMRVGQYAATPSPLYPIWIDGKRGQPPAKVEQVKGAPADFRQAHAWSEPLPAWDAPGVANVKEPPYSAAGNGATDDTEAIQRALNEKRDVFLPKGIYRISRPLRLRAGSRLFGTGVYSKIEALPDAPAFADPAKASPMLIAPNDAAATCVAAFLQFWVRHPGAYAMHWQAGRNSMVRNVLAKPYPWAAGTQAARHPVFLIDGSGGGRWYNTALHEKFPRTQGHRFLLVRSTREPLAFYMLTPEHSHADHMVEFDDARNFRVYGFKSETVGAGGPRESTPVLVRRSSGFRFYGHGGNASAPAGQPLYRLENCSDFRLANFSYQRGQAKATDPKLWHFVEDGRGSDGVVRTPATEYFTLYERK